jgi:SpoVK/Ycf46/Vps4 family AAA+-type ATPase
MDEVNPTFVTTLMAAVAEEKEMKVPDGEVRTGLIASFRRLDRLIERALAGAENAYGAESIADRFRGLHISPEEVVRLLAREPIAPVLRIDDAEPKDDSPGEDQDDDDQELGGTSQLVWLARSYGLSQFDMDVLLIALAPELDLRYERLYAYLQDDVTRRRPSVDLVLNLLCASTVEKLERRVFFSAQAPLIRNGLVHLLADTNQLQPPLLAHSLKLDDQIVRFLLGQQGLDTRLASFCRLVEPLLSLDELALDAERKRALRALVLEARDEGAPLRLYFHGPRGAGKREIAEALASETDALLLVADLNQPPVDVEFESAIKLLFREAWFEDAVLYLDGMDALRRDERARHYERLMTELAADFGITILAGTQPYVPIPLPFGGGSAGVISIRVDVPDLAARQEYWQTCLDEAGIAIGASDLLALADRFQLTPGQIAEAAATARQYAIWRAATEAPNAAGTEVGTHPSLDDLFAAARAQCGHDLAALAIKIRPGYTWNDIVLPADATAHLREICRRVAHRRRVLGEWGFGRKLSLGKGVNALFAGPSGTGKTMAAEIIANELGLDLYKVELSGVVSKWIGETEKNLDRIFNAAEHANAILFFDEADALFGKRSEVRDSHDRYANIEISYLLQKMEEYEGVAILATNLRQNLDESFVRRLAFTISFPFPDEADRRRIWSGIWPAETPLAPDLDLDLLARRFKLSGGNIKNIALAAAFLAAENGDAVRMAHLLQATRREYQKLGKPLGAAELGAFAQEGTR